MCLKSVVKQAKKVVAFGEQWLIPSLHWLFCCQCNVVSFSEVESALEYCRTLGYCIEDEKLNWKQTVKRKYNNKKAEINRKDRKQIGEIR